MTPTPNTNHKPLRLALAIRTSERKKEGQSPYQQRQAAQRCADAGGHEIVAELDSGRSESGKTMERDTLHQVREGVRAGKWDGVILGYLDRLGRARIEESMAYVRGLVGDGGVLVAADWGPRPIDLAEPRVESMLVFQLQMNRDQWTAARDRYRTSQVNAIEAGKHVGPTKLGYRRVQGRSKAENGKLVVHPTYGPVMEEVIRRVAREGIGAGQQLLRAKVPTRRFDDGTVRRCNWTTDAVRKLLASRTYLGEVHVGEGLVKEGAHQALASVEDWTAAQRPPRTRRGNGTYRLSGYAECEHCGTALNGQLCTQRRGNVRTYARLRCPNKACGGGSSIGSPALEDHVRAELARVLGNPALRIKLAPGDLDAAKEAVKVARRKADAWSDKADPELPGFERRQAKLKLALRSAEAAFQAVAAQAKVSEECPAADQLHKPAEFERALRVARAAGMRIVVGRGRGPITSRVGFGDWLDDLDDGTGVLAA